MSVKFVAQQHVPVGELALQEILPVLEDLSFAISV